MSNLMPPGWSAHKTPDGRWYYAHASGQTQWTPPPPQQGAAPPPPGIYPQHQHNQQHPPPHQPHQQHPPPHQPHQAGPAGYPGQGSRPVQHAAAPGGYPQQQGGHAVAQGHHHHHAASGRFVHNQPVEFKLKEKMFSLSGDSFSITNVATGQPAFKVKGNALSFQDSKVLLDADGNSVYKMKESIISLRGRMQIQDAASKQTAMTLRKKGFIPMMGTSTIQVWRGDSDEGEPYLECKGDFFRKDFNIKEKATGKVVASIKRKSMNLANILLEKDTYIIRVEPGYDSALLVFLVVAVDEQYRDDGERRGYGSLL